MVYFLLNQTVYRTNSGSEKMDDITPSLLANAIGSTNAYQVENCYRPDESGRIFIDVYPDCTANVFMLPFPFFCLGCFISSTVHITMDYQEKSLSVSEASGHCYIFPCCRKEGRYTFNDIERVGYISTGIKENNILLYKPVIVLNENRGMITFGPNERGSDIQRSVLGMHYYIYGRGNPNKYVLPSSHSLQISTKK